MQTDYNTNTIDAYNASPDKYVDTTKTLVMRPELENFASLLPDKSSLVLDAGCAFGKDSAILTNMGVKLIGIDMSDELLKRAAMIHPDFEFIKMDVRNLKFPDNYFSGIWCNAVLLHLTDSDILITLKEFHRVLKMNGVIYISFKEGEGTENITETFTSDKSRFYNFKTIESVIDLLEKSDFKIIKNYTVNERDRFGADKRDLNWVCCFATKTN